MRCVMCGKVLKGVPNLCEDCTPDVAKTLALKKGVDDWNMKHGGIRSYALKDGKWVEQ